MAEESMGASLRDRAVVNGAGQAVSALRTSVPSANGTPWVHIRSQSSWHGQAEIIGTKKGLIELGHAIADAIENGSGSAVLFATDGEGYETEIRRSNTIGGLGQPFYVNEIAREQAYREFKSLSDHYKLLRKQDEEALEALRWCRANGDPHAVPAGHSPEPSIPSSTTKEVGQ